MDAAQPPTILLFDVDGTLVTTPGVGRRALERAFRARHGRSPDLMTAPQGVTDRGMVRSALDAIGALPPGSGAEAAIDALLADYLPLLEEEIRRATDFTLHRGVVDLLDALASDARRCAVGLGTGNVRAGARVKLERVGIYERFAFGGFGCDHEDRGEILRAGATRGAALLGAPLSSCRVVAIGDTPLDVAAARAIDAECVAVATCKHDVETLRAAGATCAFRDLTEPGVLEALLGGPGEP
jgi:phosphoglycolate phosphatase-like HAD superfamily hydrolase